MPNGMFGPDFRAKHPKSHLIVIPCDPTRFYDPQTEWTRLTLMMGVIRKLGLIGEYRNHCETC